MFVFMLACQTPPAPSEPVPPTPSVADAAQPERVFVWASSLNLRQEPDPAGTIVGRLTINSPLTIVERGEGWLGVRVDNGTEGWVASDFVHAEVLTAAVARERAAEGSAKEKLSWWQRAAALDSSRGVLESLAQAYDAAGESAAGDQVRSQLSWPVGLFLPSSADDTLAVEWSAGWELGRMGPIEKRHWSKYGLEPDAAWWGLPRTGPAIPLTPKDFSTRPINDCSGEAARLVRFEPVSEPIVAVFNGSPPASWTKRLTPPDITEEQARATLLKEATPRAAGAEVEVKIVPVDGAFSGTATWSTGKTNELGALIMDGVAARLRKNGTELRELDEPDAEVMGERDLFGTGQAIEITHDGCWWAARDKRTPLKFTAMTCCGC